MEEQAKRIKRIALISGIFTGVVALLLLLNYLQISKIDSLDGKALSTLVERLASEPDNSALTSEVRQLDLLARKAYFNSVWQIRTGGLLMLIGAIAFVFSMRAWLKLEFQIEEPDPHRANNRKNRLKTEQWIGVAGLLLLLAAGLSALLSVNHLQAFDAKKISSNAAQNSEADIEQVEITSIDSLGVAADSLGVNGDSLAGQPAGALIPFNETTVKQQFNGFRGAFGNGLSTSIKIPTSWSGASSKQILWKTSIPVSGKNSPVVWGDKIFLTGASPNKRVVYCIDRLTGAILWEKAADKITGSPASSPQTTDDTGLAAPTCTVDGQRVFALFGNGDILAFNFDGERVWARNLGLPDNHYGHASSLITWAGKVFVQYDTHSGCKVLALNTETGKTVWSTTRTNDVSWSSPILAKIGSKMQLILQSTPNLDGYDINTGKRLWSVECMSGEVGPSPAFGGGLVYAANEYAKMLAVDPATGKVVWENMDRLPEVSSPVYYKGLVFVATTYAVLACVDAKTGTLLWEYEAKAGFYSSPMIADGKLYIFDINGKAYIFKPGTTVNLLASPDLNENVFATPAFADGFIYVRGSKHLFAIGKKE